LQHKIKFFSVLKMANERDQVAFAQPFYRVPATDELTISEDWKKSGLVPQVAAEQNAHGAPNPDRPRLIDN
jgi:hypothetical protein